MSLEQSKLLNVIINRNLENHLLECNFGLEKENVRVDSKGVLAFTPHPKAFGNRLTNPYIKTDFSESQVEIATPVCSTIEEAYDSLEELHDKVSSELKDEYLWTQSTPPYLPKDKEIPIAVMGDKEEDNFRAVLAKKYGRKKQLISGIHYNFSFSEEFLKILHKELSKGENYIEFKNKIYLKMSKNFMKYRWLPIYLTGASPIFHKSFIKEYTEESLKLDKESCYFPYMVSLRNSDYGYKNIKSNYVSFNSLTEYIKDIDKLVAKGELQDIYEFYNSVRLKRNSKHNLAKDLIDSGIDYIELRIFDLNPLHKIGISKDSLNFIHLFMLYMLFKEDESFSIEEYEIADKNANLVSFSGRKPELYLYDYKNEKMGFKSWSLSILDEMGKMLKLLKIDINYASILGKAKIMVLDPDKTSSARIMKGVKEKSFIYFHMDKAKEYLHDSKIEKEEYMDS